MTLVKGSLMPERSKDIAGGTGVMGTSELDLPGHSGLYIESE